MPSGGAEAGDVQAAKIEPKEIDRPKVRITEKIKIKENFRITTVLKLKIYTIIIPQIGKNIKRRVNET